MEPTSKKNAPNMPFLFPDNVSAVVLSEKLWARGSLEGF